MNNIEYAVNEFAGLVDFFEIEEHEISDLLGALYSPAKFYRTFHVAKRRGGTRLIESPYPSLSKIQKIILRNVLLKFSAHDSAYGFVKKRSVLGHACVHASGRELLTIDIKDFFPSITRQMVFESLSRRGLSDQFANYISRLCSLNGRLPQGACTSPALSNLVFAPLDETFNRLARSLGLCYSRYADDLAFSGERVPRDLIGLVDSILTSRGYELNQDKVMLKLCGAKKIITGVSITTGVAKIPKAYKRKLRSEVFNLQARKGRITEMKSFDPMVFERLIGKINYVLQIEPDNAFALRKKIELSEAHQNFLQLSSNYIFK